MLRDTHLTSYCLDVPNHYTITLSHPDVVNHCPATTRIIRNLLKITLPEPNVRHKRRHGLSKLEEHLTFWVSDPITVATMYAYKYICVCTHRLI